MAKSIYKNFETKPEIQVYELSLTKDLKLKSKHFFHKHKQKRKKLFVMLKRLPSTK